MAIAVRIKSSLRPTLGDCCGIIIWAIGDNFLAMSQENGQPVPAAAQFALQQGRQIADTLLSGFDEMAAFLRVFAKKR